LTPFTFHLSPKRIIYLLITIMAPPVDVYKKTLALVEYWNGIVFGADVQEWFPPGDFSPDCKISLNTTPPSDLLESLSQIGSLLKPLTIHFDMVWIETAPGAWAHAKLNTTYVEAANPDNTVSFPQFYTLVFNEEGKVVNYIIMNDPRDMARMIGALKKD
jgi:hypothetical protein